MQFFVNCGYAAEDSVSPPLLVCLVSKARGQILLSMARNQLPCLLLASTL